MYFSYFARAQNHPDVKSGEMAMVSIALHQPSWLPDIEKDPRLAPTIEVFNAYRSGDMSTEEYLQRYIENVSCHVDATRILHMYQDSVLCCYEAPNNFCHRQALRVWIQKETGIVVPELPKSKPTHKQLDLFGGGDSE